MRHVASHATAMCRRKRGRRRRRRKVYSKLTQEEEEEEEEEESRRRRRTRQAYPPPGSFRTRRIYSATVERGPCGRWSRWRSCCHLAPTLQHRCFAEDSYPHPGNHADTCKFRCNGTSQVQPEVKETVAVWSKTNALLPIFFEYFATWL